MEKVKCEICEREINDWVGNVMIPEESYEGEIDDLQVWCKTCTSTLDSEGKGQKYHNLWELKWVKKDGEKIMQESLYADRFSKRVREKVIKLIKS